MIEILLQRADTLMAEARWYDAKIVLVDVLERSLEGPQSEAAMERLRRINRALRIADPEHGAPASLRTSPAPPAVRDQLIDPYDPSRPPPALRRRDRSTRARTDKPPSSSALSTAILVSYSSGLGLMLGMSLAEPFDRRGDFRNTSVVAGVLAAGLGAGTSVWITRRNRPTEAEAAAVAWSGIWGATLAGFTTDLWTGVNDTTANQVVSGTTLGAMLGTVVGAIYVDRADPSPGDISLLNSVALYSTAGPLLVGVALDPVQSEAYSVNGLIGTTGGLALGILAAWRWDTTRTRMLWIDAGATAGALAPWLVYPFVGESETGRRVIGGLSAAGLVAGAILAWRLTRGMDRRPLPDAPTDPPAALLPGLLQRDISGQWQIGAPTIRLLPRLSDLDDQRPAPGLLLDLAGGHF